MFAFFAQHFTHQFFKTSGKMGPGFTKALGHGVSTWLGLRASLDLTWRVHIVGSRVGAPDNLSGPSLCPQVDLGHVYGDNLDRQYQLRLFKDGKLKYQVAGDIGMGP